MPGEFIVIYVPRELKKDDMDAYIFAPRGFRFRSTAELGFYVENNFAPWALPKRAFCKEGDANGISARRALAEGLITAAELAHVKAQP